MATGMALFPGMVDYCDYEVGCLLKALDDLQIRDRTLVIFAADNGTVSGVKCPARGRLVDGGKGGMTERGICVPFIASWPGRVPVRKVSDELVDFSDMLPTLCEVVGAKPPVGVEIDGKSFVNTLLGKPEPRLRREWIYSRLGPKHALRDQRFKLMKDGHFYDLLADPWEEHDLTGSENPEVVHGRDKLTNVFHSFPEGNELPFPKGIGNKE